MVVTRGSSFRVSTNTDFVETLLEAGVNAELIDVTGLSHAEVNQRVEDQEDLLVHAPVDAFLRQCFSRAERSSCATFVGG